MDFLKEGLLRLDPGLLLWTIIVFGLLILILWKAAWKPIVEALDARAERVRSDVEGAENARLEAEKLLKEHTLLMNSAKQEAAEILAKGKEQAEALKEDLLNGARKDAAVVAERALKEIEIAKSNALNEIKAEIVNISTDIAAKIIGKNLDSSDQKGLVDDVLAKIETVH